MNWRKSLSLLAILLLAPMAAAQFTQTQGTVIDPKGTPYANGTITPFLIISGSPRFASSGYPYVPPNQATGLDAHGFFIMNLADVTQILPPGGLWTFHVCSAAGTIPPAGGAGPVCFDTPGLAISGTVQDISTTLQAAAPPLTGPGGGGGGPKGVVSIPPSGDTTGATDGPAITAACTAGASIVLSPGKYYIGAGNSHNITLGAPCSIRGQGPASTVIQSENTTADWITVNFANTTTPPTPEGSGCVIDGITLIEDTALTVTAGAGLIVGRGVAGSYPFGC